MAGKMLFHRDFLGYTGGHGKVWDYFNHALALGWDARVFLTPCSLRDPALNPWMSVPERIETVWRPAQADLLFLAGMDWDALDPAGVGDVPTLNLVQHVRHADPSLPLRAFLSQPAFRICVSQAVSDAILATGEVAGPVRVIPAALNLPELQSSRQPRQGVFIGALKQPGLGAEVARRLRADGHAVTLADQWLPRTRFLSMLASAQVALLLPHATEGFFLPGLEAMALDCALVMPASLGSGQYAVNEHNCLMPNADPQALAVAVASLMQVPALSKRLRDAGRATADSHTLAVERMAFAEVLAQVAA